MRLLRFLVWVAIAGLALAAPMASAQGETTVEITITATPESYTVQTGEFQRDENGDRIRDENGSFVPVEQFVTITVEASLPCAVPPNNEGFRVASSGPTWTRDEGGEKRVLLGLDVREFDVLWEQDSPTSDWTASYELENRILNEGTSGQTIEAEYTWSAEFIGYPATCEPDYVQIQSATHELILQGTDAAAGSGDGGDGGEGPTDGSQGTPAPGVLPILLTVGLAALLRRRTL